MSKLLGVSCWSSFPSRAESAAWGAVGVAVAALAIALLSML